MRLQNEFAEESGVRQSIDNDAATLCSPTGVWSNKCIHGELEPELCCDLLIESKTLLTERKWHYVLVYPWASLFYRIIVDKDWKPI